MHPTDTHSTSFRGPGARIVSVLRKAVAFSYHRCLVQSSQTSSAAITDICNEERRKYPFMLLPSPNQIFWPSVSADRDFHIAFGNAAQKTGRTQGGSYE